MAKVCILRRSLLGAVICFTIAVVLGPKTASALCASPVEMGRWRNMSSGDDPQVIDLRMSDCGDQVLNGVQTETRYSMRVWVKQSSGQLYGRPIVIAYYRNWNGKRWLTGRVPTGGYIDNMWARIADHDGQQALYVLIKHESLDSKPSATSEHWFKFEKRI